MKLNTIKRTIILLLVLALLHTALPALSLPVRAEGTYSGTCGDNLTWSFDESIGLLSIEGSGEMYDYDFGWEDSDFSPWSQFCDKITAIALPKTLTTIGTSAFAYCSMLSKIEIPEGVSSIRAYAFSGCSNLSTVDLPNSLSYIDASAFVNTAYYKNDSNWNNGTLFIDHWLIDVKDTVTTITISEDVVGIAKYAFSDCSNLLSFNVANGNRVFCSDSYGVLFNKEKTNLIQYPLGREGSYAILDTVLSLSEGSFSHCNGLTAVTIGNSISVIPNYAFSHCQSLASVKLGDNVVSIGSDAFHWCVNLTDIGFPDSLTSIGDRAFANCYALPSVYIPARTTSIGAGAFAICDSLKRISVDPENSVYASDEYGVLFDKNMSTMIEYPGGRAGAYTVPSSVTAIEDGCGSDCLTLTALTISENVKKIGREAFSFSSVVTVLVPESVTTIEWGAFFDCKNLTIYGYSGSAVETYANTYRINFVSLTENPCALGHNFVNGVCTRCGKEQTASDMFSDVKDNAYYANAVLWAVQNGITSGTGDGQFSPKKTCTREQVVSFLWKAAGSPEPEATSSPFPDVKPSKYYFKPVLWALERGITSGQSDGRFGVGKACTREQVVSFLWKAIGSPEPEGTESPFSDVKPGKYYYKPVLWAVENGVTSGASATSFGVGKSCTRAQIVTFLYNVYGK